MIVSTMRRKIGFLIGLVGLVLLVIVLVKVLSGRTPKLGILKVNSSPTASIFLDNKHIGRTPYEDKVTSGEYTVKIVPESTVSSLASWQGKVTIGANTLTYINRDLSESELTSAGEVLWLEKISSRLSEISVTTSPDGATLLVDNENKGNTPTLVQNIEGGDHTITVTSPGFLTRTLKVKTTNGYRLTAAIQLALSPGSTTPTPEASPSPTISGSPKPTPKVSPTKAAVADPPKPFVIIKDTPTGFLRVRMGPSSSATEAAQVKPGEKYTFFDTQNGWYEIKFNGVDTGWVSGQYVEKVE